MNVLIVGYGRMGREIETVLADRGHSVAGRVDPFAPEADAKTVAQWDGTADAAIEFAAPDGVVDNARTYGQRKLPAVVGTTGWEARRDEVRSIVESAGGSYLWGANFSVGANLFFALVEAATGLIDSFESYDPMMVETHHKGKKDSPSGTALEAARRLIKSSTRKSKVVTEALQRQIAPDELHVASIRGGSVPGTHRLDFDSPFDTITVQHTARTRSGFALGSVLAAEWITSRTGFYSFDDFFSEQL